MHIPPSVLLFTQGYLPTRHSPSGIVATLIVSCANDGQVFLWLAHPTEFTGQGILNETLLSPEKTE